MELLIPSPGAYEKDTEPFRTHLSPYAQRIDDLVSSGQTPLCHFLDKPGRNPRPAMERYRYIFRWPIRQMEYSFHLRHIRRLLQPGRVAMDAGCGVTPFAHFLAQTGCTAYGIDGNAEGVEMMKKHAEKAFGSHVVYDHQDLTRLTFPDSFFDVITCTSVLEHILPRTASTDALGEMIRVLKPGGILSVTVDFHADDIDDHSPRHDPGLLHRSRERLRHWARQCRKVLAALHLVRPGRVPGPSGPGSGTRPFRFTEMEAHLVAPFRPAVVLPVPRPFAIGTDQIRRFWKDHWFPECQYDKEAGRLYAAVGLLFRKPAA